MNPHLQRAQMLYSRSRYDEAERELGMALTKDPEEPWAYALLGACRAAQKDFNKADELGRQAMALAPDSADIRHLAARIQLARNDLPAAERTVTEAIELDPHDADYYATRAMVHAQRKAWDKALADCEAALELDPEHLEAINVRSLARRGKGDTQTATAELEHALRVDPEDAHSHANLGWTHLQRGQRDDAEKHFREALRLDPDLESARVGVVETLKARVPVYRWILSYFLWMSQQTAAMQWAIIIGLLILSRIADGIAGANPTLAPFVQPMIYFYILFCVASWIAKPLSDALLLLHPLGRLSLTGQEKREGLITGALFATTIGLVVWMMIERGFLSRALALAVGATGLPIALSFQTRHPKPRRILQLGAVVIGAMGAVVVTIAATDDWADSWPAVIQQAIALPSLRILPFTPIITVIGANILASQQWRE